MNAQINPANVDVLRLPPQSLEAEQSVLGGLMLVPEALAKLADWLTADDFYRREHRMIFRAITEFATTGKPFDAVTIGEWFERNGEAASIGGPAYVTELASNTPSAANIVAYAEIVVEKSRLRRVIETGTRIAGSAFDGRTASQDLIATAMYDMAQMQTSALRTGLEPVKTALVELYQQMTERYSRAKALLGLPTPWHDLNTKLDGLLDGQLYVLGARPSMGKSVFVGQVAVMTALRGQRTAWFSVEMSAEQCMARAVACLADVDYRWVRNPHEDPHAIDAADSNAKWSHVVSANEALLKSSLLIDDTPALSIAQLVARARRAHMQAPLRLIVIDHMHDMRIDPKQARFDYGAIAQGAKTLAKECHCPVLLAAQLNRGVTARANNRPTLPDLRESGEIEQKADVVMFLHRDDYYDTKKNPGVVDVILAKGRDIEIGAPVHLKHRFDRMRLEDWDGPLPSYDEAPAHGDGFKPRRRS